MRAASGRQVRQSSRASRPGARSGAHAAGLVVQPRAHCALCRAAVSGAAVLCALDQAAWEASPEHVRAMHHGTAAVLATALFDFVTRTTLERAHGDA